MDEKNLIYMSDVTHQSIQAKDDITFKFNTALTTTEAIEKGVCRRNCQIIAETNRKQ